MSFKIAAFYRFLTIAELAPLDEIRSRLRVSMKEHSILGTIILAEEGYNATVCGREASLDEFLVDASVVLGTDIRLKISFHAAPPFRRAEVKIKPEIVTLRRPVNMAFAGRRRVSPDAWNALIADPETIVLDARNWYEAAAGRFPNAIDPGTTKFSELPEFIAENLFDLKSRTVAMYCTGGIRCEKLAPFLLSKGFERVVELDGGILGYLERVSPDENLWQGECFVFDARVSVDRTLRKGRAPDISAGDMPAGPK